MKLMESELPVVALRGLTVLPQMDIHFDISRAKSISAVEKAVCNNGLIMLVTQLSTETVDPGFDDVYHVGTVARIKQILKLPNKVVRVIVEGEWKARLIDILDNAEYILGSVEIIEENQSDISLETNVRKGMLKAMIELISAYGVVDQGANRDFLKRLLGIRDVYKMVAVIGTEFPMDFTDRQRYLECDSFEERYEFVLMFLRDAVEIAQIKATIAAKVKKQVEENQKEYVLREQMKVISNELGDGDFESESEDFLKMAEELDAPDEVKEKLKKEINRYKSMSQSSMETSVTRGYIETLLELPWNKKSKDNLDVIHAKEILDEDHYGLVKVKERIVEFLSVRALTGKGETPIICLVGPPGTGKTSIAKSMARALNREYIRISLGGVRDEAEIRGHRRTYVGAMPGRLVEGLRKAKVCNPLMLLDEIDKIGRDNYKGDTEAALLEVLDMAQNSAFRDRYVELPIDLSNVLFIATANDISNVSKPLLDRMEVIELSSYTENEKFHIAKNFLIKKQLEANGLKSSNLKISDATVYKIIDGYTREAGVRGLYRCFGTICRKAAKEIVTGEKKCVKVNADNITEYLGNVKYKPDKINSKPMIGVVRGLAWTSVGGDTLSVEIVSMPGKGNMEFTGQIGDVMQESAKVAFTYVRSIAPEYGLASDVFEGIDMHMHIPEGAVPKDGPSAGVTMATAILSALANKKVRADLAMTGEITIRGQILPVGGLKEKLIAAVMAGVKTVIVPETNKSDIEELEEEITSRLEIIYAKTMKDVLKVSFA